MIELADVEQTLCVIELRGGELKRRAEKYREAGDDEGAAYLLKMRERLYEAWDAIHDDASIAGLL